MYLVYNHSFIRQLNVLKKVKLIKIFKKEQETFLHEVGILHQ